MEPTAVTFFALLRLRWATGGEVCQLRWNRPRGYEGADSLSAVRRVRRICRAVVIHEDAVPFLSQDGCSGEGFDRVLHRLSGHWTDFVFSMPWREV